MVDNRQVTLLKMAIAGKDVKKKNIAKRCRISKSYLSQMLHGDQEMPVEVRDKIISILGIEDVFNRFMEINHD